ncbi:MAG: general secretion pathway protein H [Paraglaciecola sp.]|jgi:general secretion pathway protein H
MISVTGISTTTWASLLMPKSLIPTRPKSRGFTLIEVMLVLAIMGMVVSTVVFNVSGQSGEDRLKKQVQRFQVVFSMAGDFAVLNQRQLGLRVEQEKQQYAFMVLDDDQQWQELSIDKVFSSYTLPEEFSFALELNDLPWDTDDSLFNEGSFDAQLSVSDEGVSIGEEDEEQKKLPPPQVLLLSSGDITPFSVTFTYEPDFGDERVTHFRINGQDSLPLIREGPLDTL